MVQDQILLDLLKLNENMKKLEEMINRLSFVMKEVKYQLKRD